MAPGGSFVVSALFIPSAYADGTDLVISRSVVKHKSIGNSLKCNRSFSM